MIIFHFLKTWTIDTLFPVRCVGCHIPDQILCESCSNQIVMIKQQQCAYCLNNSAHGKTCHKCRNKGDLDRLVVVCHYEDGPIKELIHTYKYNGQIGIASVLSKIIQEHPEIKLLFSELRRSKQKVLIAPVPLHRKRLWWRGFNQSELLAKRLGKRFSVTVKNPLVRTVATVPQVKLSRAERLRNLSRAFKVKNNALSDYTVVLVDDIATTGSTLSACASILKSVGVKRVYGLVIARAV